jgi:hypothetical protein
MSDVADHTVGLIRISGDMAHVKQDIALIKRRLDLVDA